MKNHRICSQFRAWIAAACFFCNAVPGFAVSLTILHTNDTHGHLDSWVSDDVSVGGIVNRAAMIKRIRKETSGRRSLLLLDAGDVNDGTPVSDANDARPDFECMRLMGYDAMCVGNHEIYPDAALRARQRKWAGFPMLSANIRKTDGTFLYEPMLIKTVNGQRIVIFGLTTLATYAPKHVKGLMFERPSVAAARMVSRLEPDDLVIALTHLGVPRNGRDSQGTDYELALKVPDIDIIIGGHSHTYLARPLAMDGTLICQTGCYGQYMGRLDCEVENGRITHWTYKSLLVTGQADSKNDPYKVRSHLASFSRPPNPLVGNVPVRFPRRSSRKLLGELAADALRWRTGSDISLYNSGGIRQQARVGPLRMNGIREIWPFANTTVVFKINGAQFYRVLEYGLGKRKGGAACFSGCLVRYRPGNREGTRPLRIDSVLINGKRLDPEAFYTLATNSYLADGGDGYDMFEMWPAIEIIAEPNYTTIAKWISGPEKGILKPPDGKRCIASYP